jgi:hypothetical protein
MSRPLPELTRARAQSTRATRRVYKTLHYMRTVISPADNPFQWEYWGEVLIDHVCAAIHAAQYRLEIERQYRRE